MIIAIALSSFAIGLIAGLAIGANNAKKVKAKLESTEDALLAATLKAKNELAYRMRRS